MDPKLQPVSISGRPLPLPGGTDAVAAERNNVLRNTYWLLALSMLPVVAARGSACSSTSWRCSARRRS
jgi:hypothetical protein